MVRWVKLFGNQYLGFWVLGLVLFALQELPYMLMPLCHLETNPIMNMTETSVILDICEKVLGSLCIALMVFIVHRGAKLFSVSDGKEKLFFTLAIILLLANKYIYHRLATEHSVIDLRCIIPCGTLHACAGESERIRQGEYISYEKDVSMLLGFGCIVI